MTKADALKVVSDYWFYYGITKGFSNVVTLTGNQILECDNARKCYDEAVKTLLMGEVLAC